jgi:hypothetical protein
MDDWQKARLRDTELKAFFDRFFPQGFAGPDVLAELAPKRWEKPLRRVHEAVFGVLALVDPRL